MSPMWVLVNFGNEPMKSPQFGRGRYFGRGLSLGDKNWDILFLSVICRALW